MRAFLTYSFLGLTMLFVTFSCQADHSYDETLAGDQFRDWSVYLGDQWSTQYSSLDQINRDNVGELQVAWQYSTDDTLEGVNTTMQSNSIIIEGVLYTTTPLLKLIALNAITGELIWSFDPFEGEQARSRGVNRGVSFWDDSSGDRRLFYVAADRMYAVNADSGEPVSQFGSGLQGGAEGSIDFRYGLNREGTDYHITSSTPGIVFRDLLITGSTVYNRVSGSIRAFNVRTGELEWIFHTIPRPGEYGYETWPEDAWKRVGNANSWAGMSLDESREIVYVPTASPGHDFYGGDREGDNLFGTSLIALDANTGRRIWHYQVIRHDIWDWDLATPPNLVTIERHGRRVDAVAQVTKHGHTFVFDRETGEPLFPIREVDVPPSDLRGEVVAGSQPIPVLPEPFARQTFHEYDLSALTPQSHESLVKRYRSLRTDHMWDPPSTQGTVIFPGLHGGAEWGGAAVDPVSGVLYINSSEMPWIIQMVDLDEERIGGSGPGFQLYQAHCIACHGPAHRIIPGSVPSVGEIVEDLSDQQLQSIIESGPGSMPSFSDFEEDELEQLIAYLRREETDEVRIHPLDASEMADPSRIPYSFTGYHRWYDSEGYPAVKPPWGTLNAIDLNTGATLWQIPLGEHEELTRRGIPPTGTENYGGPVVTAGGLLFIAATQDEKFRAFDKETGELLWETTLPAAGFATPSVYEADGRQFVSIAAGGGRFGRKTGDSIITFSLPNTQNRDLTD